MPGKLFLILPKDLEDTLSTERTIDKINKCVTIFGEKATCTSALAGFHSPLQKRERTGRSFLY